MRRVAPLILVLAGCAALAVAEFSRLYEIKVITVTVETATVGSHHGYALLIIAVAAAAMAWLAIVGGSRPAGFALTLLAVVALAVVLAIDLPVVDDTGLYGRNYEAARAETGTGFYLETAGAIVLLLGAVSNLVFGLRVSGAPRPPRTRGLGAPAEEG